MSIEDYANSAEKYSLSDKDIMQMTDNLYKIWVYDDLVNIRSVDELLGNHLGCVILYQTETKTNGHWVCMYRNADTLFYFGSYGLPPDEPLKFYKDKRPPAYLTKLLKSSPYKLITNKYRYQELNEKVNTCGRWCAYRLKNRHLNNTEFNKLFDNKHYDPDFWISILTSHCGSFNS